MAITPNTYDFSAEYQTEEFADKTYKIDFKENRIVGEVDGIDAVEQAAYKILSTERFDYLIYSWNYGVELERLIGKDYDFILGDLQRRIEEALTQDDRIKKIDKLTVDRKGTDSIEVSFVIVSKYGDLSMEVDIDV